MVVFSVWGGWRGGGGEHMHNKIAFKCKCNYHLLQIYEHYTMRASFCAFTMVEMSYAERESERELRKGLGNLWRNT